MFEPGWKPEPPLYGRSTLKFSAYWPGTDGSSPKVRFWAIARMWPVPGWTTLMATPARSVSGTCERTASQARAWSSRLMVVSIRSPPRSSRFSRASGVSP